MSRNSTLSSTLSTRVRALPSSDAALINSNKELTGICHALYVLAERRTGATASPQVTAGFAHWFCAASTWKKVDARTDEDGHCAFSQYKAPVLDHGGAAPVQHRLPVAPDIWMLSASPR